MFVVIQDVKNHVCMLACSGKRVSYVPKMERGATSAQGQLGSLSRAATHEDSQGAGLMAASGKWRAWVGAHENPPRSLQFSGKPREC